MTDTDTRAPAVTAEDRGLNDLFTTAIESGIGYWAQGDVYWWSTGDGETPARDFSIRIREIDDEDEDEFPHTLDREALKRGIDLAYAWYATGAAGDPYQLRALTRLKFGKWDEVDYDAITADFVVQFALLGELVYG